MHSNFFCKSSHLNLYKKPSYKSKIGSQILYGEKFRILQKKKKFIKVKTSYDNYIGYIKSSNYINKFRPTHKISVLKSKIFKYPKNLAKYKSKKNLSFSSKIQILKKYENFIMFDKNRWLNIKDIKLAEGGGLLFPVRFRNEVLAIKEKAKEYALQFTTLKGGTEVVNVSGLMQFAHNELAKKIITPIADRFTGYKVDTSDIAKQMSYRVMQADSINLNSDFYKDNLLTDKDFVVKDLSEPDVRGVSTGATHGIVVSQNAANVMEEEIKNLDSMSTQKLYVDYLPDNLVIQTPNGVVPLKTYYKNIFALASY